MPHDTTDPAIVNAEVAPDSVDDSPHRPFFPFLSSRGVRGYPMGRMLSIVSIPDPVLRLEAGPVNEIDASIRALTDQMFAALEDAQGIGLAAPQVGKSLQMFIVYIKTDVPRVFINPTVLETSLETTKHEEGCLSIPGVYADVVRPEAVQVQAWNEKGKPFSLAADGLLARVILHEYDHLKGVLFPDYLPTRRREKIWRMFEAAPEPS